MFDTTPDVAHTDQSSQIIQYITTDKSKVQVMESPWYLKYIKNSENNGAYFKLQRNIKIFLNC